MNTLTINYQDDITKEKIIFFIKNFISEKVEICDLEDIKDLLLIQEAKKENLSSIKFEDVLKEFNCEN